MPSHAKGHEDQRVDKYIYRIMRAMLLFVLEQITNLHHVITRCLARIGRLTPHMPEPSLELSIAAMQTELSRHGNGIVLRLMLLLRYLSSRGSVRILVLLLLLTLLLILLPLDLVSTGGYAVVRCHDAFLSNTTG